jgi:hypothetical protein
MSIFTSQMLTAYEAHCGGAHELLKHYGIIPPKHTFDDFQFGVQQSFYEGVHEVYQTDILNMLTKKYGNQQNIAEHLGLKDHSSISRMKRYKRMDSLRFTTALYLNPDLTLPSQERAALFGFARATSHVKAMAYGDPSFEGVMTAQDFSYLVGILASSEWYSAIQAKDYSIVRELAEQIIQERAIAVEGVIRNDGIRPEQFVLKLQDLWLSWADFGILALYAIPELIPEGKEA